MPGQMRINFKGFSGLVPTQLQRARAPGTSGGAAQDAVLRAAIGALAGTAKRGPMLRGAQDMITPPFGTITLGGLIPGITIRSPLPDFTIAVGVAGGFGAVLNFSGGGGVYLSNKAPRGEVGLYGSLSLGLVANMGVSIGDQFCVMFGKPEDVLAGDSITISVDIGIDIFTMTGMLILNAPPVSVGLPGTRSWPPSITGPWKPEVIGIGIAMSAGISAMPFDISVMPGRTWIKPVT